MFVLEYSASECRSTVFARGTLRHCVREARRTMRDRKRWRRVDYGWVKESGLSRDHLRITKEERCH